MTEKDQTFSHSPEETTEALEETLNTDLPEDRPPEESSGGQEIPQNAALSKEEPASEGPLPEGETARGEETYSSPNQEEAEEENSLHDVFAHEPLEEAPEAETNSSSGESQTGEERSSEELSSRETSSPEEPEKDQPSPIGEEPDGDESDFHPLSHEAADTRLINLTGGQDHQEEEDNLSEKEGASSKEPEEEIKIAPVERPKSSKAKSNSKEPGQKKKKGLFIALITAGALALIYLVGVWRFSSAFMPNTYVDGYNAVNQSVASLEKKIGDDTAKRTVMITGAGGQTMDVVASDIGFTFDKSIDFNKIIKEQNPWSWPVSFFEKRRDFDSGYTYDKQKLASVIASSPFVQNANVTEAKNAEAVYDGNTFVIQEEVYGTHVNEGALQDAVVTALANNQKDIDLESQKLYYQPSITKDDQALKASVDKLNKNLSTVITYDFGDKKETLDKNTFASWLHTDDHGNVTVDADQAAAYVEGLAEKYDTLYTYRPFKTSAGNTIDVFAEGYGWEIDQDEETDKLVSLLESGTSQEREPIYAVEGADRSLSNAVGGTYVEISIPDQTMWLYQNGNRVLSTPITTGTAGQYDTPRGLYQVAYKSTHVTLRGEGYASPVTFWIPFNGGIGIHDASWRSNYGGSYYLTGGSHGCINTPYNAVATIYDAVDAGTPVVVY